MTDDEIDGLVNKIAGMLGGLSAAERTLVKQILLAGGSVEGIVAELYKNFPSKMEGIDQIRLAREIALFFERSGYQSGIKPSR